jgi:hypothetical protein
MPSLNAFHQRARRATLLTGGDLHALEALFLAVRAIDVFQGDMDCFSFEGILTEVASAKEQGLLVASHPRHHQRLSSEHDPFPSRFVGAEGYDRKDGASTVPAATERGYSLVKRRAK